MSIESQQLKKEVESKLGSVADLFGINIDDMVAAVEAGEARAQDREAARKRFARRWGKNIRPWLPAYMEIEARLNPASEEAVRAHAWSAEEGWPIQPVAVADITGSLIGMFSIDGLELELSEVDEYFFIMIPVLRFLTRLRDEQVERRTQKRRHEFARRRAPDAKEGV